VCYLGCGCRPQVIGALDDEWRVAGQDLARHVALVEHPLLGLGRLEVGGQVNELWRLETLKNIFVLFIFTLHQQILPLHPPPQKKTNKKQNKNKTKTKTKTKQKKTKTNKQKTKHTKKSRLRGARVEAAEFWPLVDPGVSLVVVSPGGDHMVVQRHVM